MDYTLTTEDKGSKDSVTVETSPLSLSIDEKLIIEIVEKRMADAKKFNEEELHLDTRTKENEKFWLGDQINTKDLARYLEPYKDNIIWQDSEKRIEMAAGRMPEIVLTPAGEDQIKRDRAKLLEKLLQIEFSSGKMKRLIKDGLRQHGIYMLAAIKCRWDANKGENGDYVFELVRPSRFGLDHTGTISHDGFTIDNIDMFWETVEEPLAITLAKFPKKAQALKDMLQVGTDPKRMISKLSYTEVHYTWYTNDGQPMECVLWKYKTLLLDNIKTPYYDYTGFTKRVYDNKANPALPDQKVASSMGKFYRNHFEKPRKNYILFSHQNLGRGPHDDTSIIEQTIPLQKSINKRGRQITDIADRMRPRFAFNAGVGQKKTVEEISNDPEDHIYINSNDPISNLVTSFESQPPSPILFNDLVSNRGQIDAKFSTHGTTRGEIQGRTHESGLSKQITREGDLISSDDIVQVVIERVVYEMASWCIQMMKLFYDKPHYIRNIGPDGEMIYAELTRDLIDDGIDVNVASSSVDKLTRRNDAFNLAKVKGIDPLTLNEDMDYPTPKERTRRLMLFLMGPQDGYARYMQETGLLENSNDPQATAQMLDPNAQAPAVPGPGMPTMLGNGQPPMPPGQGAPQLPPGAGQAPPPAGPPPQGPPPQGAQQFGQPPMMDAQQAQEDLQDLINGQDVQPNALPSPEYVMVFVQFWKSPAFANLPEDVQNRIAEYLRLLNELVNQVTQNAGG